MNHIKKNYLILYPIILLFLSLTGCVSKKNELPPAIKDIIIKDTIKKDTVIVIPPKPIVCSPDSVYFKQTILPLMLTSCAKSGCHDNITKKSGVVLVDYASIKSNSVVSNPANSNIYRFLNATTKRMPPSPAPKFTTQQAELVLKWVQQGAKNNSCDQSSGECGKAISFKNDVQPILSKNNCLSCHGATSPSGGVVLSNHTGVSAKAKEGSLYGSISHQIGFSPMPSDILKISDCDIKTIKGWIDAGAKND